MSEDDDEKKKIGFARLSLLERQQIGHTGGKVAARKRRKRPHRWDSKEAARAARKGHKNSPGPRVPRKHWGQHTSCKSCSRYLRNQRQKKGDTDT